VDDVLVERVLRAVELVPPGQVVSYGDIAALVGTGPRQVGSIMRLYGSNVTWWRVTNASGDFPAALRQRAFAHWAEEGIPVRADGRGCRIRDHRVDLRWLATEHSRATADLG